jgi:hypothetical protein
MLENNPNVYCLSIKQQTDCSLEVAIWLVRPDGHIIWTVHVCVAIGVASYLAWSFVSRKGRIPGCGAHCFSVRSLFIAVKDSLRWLDDG